MDGGEVQVRRAHEVDEVARVQQHVAAPLREVDRLVEVMLAPRREAPPRGQLHLALVVAVVHADDVCVRHLDRPERLRGSHRNLDRLQVQRRQRRALGGKSGQLRGQHGPGAQRQEFPAIDLHAFSLSARA